jgi:hypothetical protein
MEAKVTICHRTGSSSHPWVEITVSRNALPAHQAHGDIIPAPPGGCPGTLTATPTGSVTATSTPTVTPSATGTPLASPTATAQTITICHATGSAKHPYVLITIDINGLNGHMKHPGDIIPAPPGGCPTAQQQPSNPTSPGNGNGKGNGGNNGNGANNGGNANGGNGNGNGNGNGKGNGNNKGNQNKHGPNGP